MLNWEKLLTFRCTGCGNCCRETMVMVTDADIRRLVDGTGRPWQRVARFVPEGDIIMDKRSPWWVCLRARRYVLILRWKRRSCAFLGADDRCTVYDHRPVACREHPFNIEHSAAGALVKLSKSRLVDCPHAWDGQQSRRELVALSRWTDRESDAYTTRLKEWNRLPAVRRTRADFLRFFGIASPA